jgi:hypothetical protein
MSKRPPPIRSARQQSGTADRRHEVVPTAEPQTGKLDPHVRRPGTLQRVLFAVAVCALLAWLALLTYMAFG